MLQLWIPRVITWCLSFIAVCLSCLTALSCSFLRNDATALNLSGETVLEDSNDLGLFQYRDNNNNDNSSSSSSCINYGSDIQKPPVLKAAQAFAILSVICGALAMLVLSSMFFLPIRVMIWRVGLVGIFCGCILFQSLTFLMFALDNCQDQIVSGVWYDVECKAGSGAFLSIAAGVFYFVIVVVMLNLAVPERSLFGRNGDLVRVSGGERRQQQQQQQVGTTTTTTTNPQNVNMHTVKEVYHNEDGSTTTIIKTTNMAAENTPLQ